MARLTDRQQLERVLGLLTGVGHPEVRARLAERGFREEDENEGWRLLRKAAGAFYAGASPGSGEDPLPAIDAWENRWFPTARAALARRYPAVEKLVFTKLKQKRGTKVLLSVTTFVSRIEALATSSDETERAAARFLAQRGLGRAALDEVKALLETAMTLDGGEAFQPPPPPADREAALSELWAFYLDWSATARAVVSEPRLRRVLGFGRG